MVAEKVVKHRAARGITFDGDADRALVADEHGNVVNGDAVLLLAARDLQSRGLLANSTVVATTMSNMGLEAALKVDHPIIKDMYKYTSSKSITPEMLAAAFELDEYLVSKASYATNEEGAAGAYSFIAGKNALLCVADGSPSIMEPCAGATFTWTELTAVNSAGIAIDQYYDVKTKEDVVRGQFAFDMKVTGSDLGYFFNAVIS